jgi:hypothetical protein
MTEFINPFSKALAFYGVSDPWNIETASGRMRPSNEIQRQPAMIGYVNSFHLLALVAAVGVPLVPGSCACGPSMSDSTHAKRGWRTAQR